MKTVVVSMFAVMVLAGSALAAIPSTTDYLLATQPMISGKVASVDDHKMVVDTDQGEHVTLAVDSKTMVPTDLAPGMVMRVEFKAMPDGHLYARRVIPIRGGASTARELAYTHTSGDATAQTASNGSASDGTAAGAGAGAGAGAAEGTGEGATKGTTGAAGNESLPQTAGVQPLIALLGLLALASAGVLAVTRRLRSA